MRFSALLMIAVLAVTFGTLALAEAPQKHDFARLQRLSNALDNFNYPEQATKSITVWLQGGGKGTSATVDSDTLDLTAAVKMGSSNLKDVDLANVAVLHAGGTLIQFVDMQECVKSNKPSAIIVNRGDLVALLVR